MWNILLVTVPEKEYAATEHTDPQMSTELPSLFCSKCGTQAASESLFCCKCGARLVIPDGAGQQASSLQPKPSAIVTPAPLPVTPIAPASRREALVVAADGSGTHASISAAISAALPGDTIQIKSGFYEEALLITVPLVFVGSEKGLVIVHHPILTAVTVKQTEVVFENISFALRQDAVSFSSESSVLRVSGCCFAPVDELAKNQNAVALPTLISQLKAGASHWKPENQSVTASAEPQRKDSVLFNGGSVTMKASMLIRAYAAGSGLTFNAEDSTFLASELRFSESSKATLNRCDAIDATFQFVKDTIANINNCRFEQIFQFALFYQTALSSIEDCEFIGTWNPSASAPGGADPPNAIRLANKVDLRLARTKFTRFAIAIHGWAAEDAIEIRDCVIADNREGIRISRWQRKGVLLCLSVQQTQFDGNQDAGLDVFDHGEFKNTIVNLNACRFANNATGARIIGCKGFVQFCEFANNKENARLDVGFLLKSVRNCKGIGESKATKFFQKATEWLS